MTWFDIPSPDTAWLVDGLIPSDGHAAICGKPKAGKSTFVRNLIAAVIKGRPFLGRAIDIPEDIGRVLYVHLDRKDQPWRVAAELRHLGITQEESARLIFKTAQDVPESFEDRLAWLQKEVVESMPHLVVIDLLWQFVISKGTNDYNAVLAGINKMQDALTKVGYKGALVVTMHGRKATNPADTFDDILGSTAQRGSFSTNVMLTRRRKEGVYTISSDQTERDEMYGEIPETILQRNTEGILAMLRPFSELINEEKETRAEINVRRVLDYITEHPGCLIDQIMGGLKMAKKTVLKALEMASELWYTAGEGEKGDPFRYFPKDTIATPQAEAQRLMYAN